MNNQSHTSLKVNEVLDFWFGRSNSPEFGKIQKKWFEKDLAFDEEVRSGFLSQYELAAAEQAVKNKFDRELLPVQRWFIYLPFEHSENLEHQQKSVELFSNLQGETDSELVINYAIRHLEVIERFGRFPHRNQILGRETTPEEAEFLKQPGSAF